MNHMSSEGMVALFRALCARSEGPGVARNEVAAGIVVPRQIIARPFAPPKRDTRYTLDDGLILR